MLNKRKGRITVDQITWKHPQKQVLKVVENKQKVSAHFREFKTAQPKQIQNNHWPDIPSHLIWIKIEICITNFNFKAENQTETERWIKMQTEFLLI